MVKRICPECFTRWYSTDTSNKDWICESCGSKIPYNTQSEDLKEQNNIKENN